MNNTPETDRYVKMRASLGYCIDRDAADFARRLERERDDLQKALDAEKALPSNLLDVDAICKQRDELLRERNDLAEWKKDAIPQLIDYQAEMGRLKGEREEAQRQRDMLLNFVESLVSALGPHTDINGSSVIPAAYNVLRAVKGGSHE